MIISIDNVINYLFDSKTIFCSNVIIEKDKYQHLLPQRKWR